MSASESGDEEMSLLQGNYIDQDEHRKRRSLFGMFVSLVTLFLVVSSWNIIYDLSALETNGSTNGCGVLGNCTSERPENFMAYFTFRYGYVFNFISFIGPAFGGIVGDAVLGRFYTLVIGSVMYFIGALLFYFLITDHCALVYQDASLVLVAIATCLIFTNIIAIGGQESERTGMKISNYFIFMYISYSLANVIGRLILLIGWPWISLVPIIVSALWLLINIIYFWDYEKDAPDYGRVYKTFTNLFEERLLVKDNHSTLFSRSVEEEALPSLNNTSITNNCSLTLDVKKPQAVRDKDGSGMNTSWLWNFLPMYAIFFVYIIALLDTSYDIPNQLRYILRLGCDTFSVRIWTSATFITYYSASALVLSILFFIPKHRWVTLWCPFRRLLFSHVTMFLGLLLAGILSSSYDTIANKNTNLESTMEQFSIYIPQTILCGISEGLGVSAAFHIGYVYAPCNLRSMSLGIMKTMWGLGFFVVICLQYGFTAAWIPVDTTVDTTGAAEPCFYCVYFVLTFPVVLSFTMLMALYKCTKHPFLSVSDNYVLNE